MRDAGRRDDVHLAFGGGGVTLDDLPAIRAAGANAAGVGRAILNALARSADAG